MERLQLMFVQHRVMQKASRYVQYTWLYYGYIMALVEVGMNGSSYTDILTLANNTIAQFPLAMFLVIVF